jgi:hypothetical protein
METRRERGLRPGRSGWALVLVVALAPPASAERVADLNPWTAESYASVSGSADGLWTVGVGGISVLQSVNGQPTLFYSDFALSAQVVDVRLRVASGAGDDDLIGFALGFRPGDSSSGSAEYLLIDWKKAEQTHDFGTPSDTPGATCEQGLFASWVTGVPTADELWGRVNFDHPSSGPFDGVEVLDRGTTDGWLHDLEYLFTFELTETTADIYLDGVLQMALTGDFGGLFDGRLAFYNFSQGQVTYRGVTLDPCDEPGDPSARPADVGPVLRATGHGDPRAAEVSASFDWSDDQGAPRGPREHYHVLAGAAPGALLPLTELHRSQTEWTESLPAAGPARRIRFYEVLASNNCEELSDD